MSALDIPDRVCGSLDCEETDGVEIVHTPEHGRIALCETHREDLEVNGGV